MKTAGADNYHAFHLLEGDAEREDCYVCQSPDLRTVLIKELKTRHFNGEGCGTHGSNACSHCYGPSPMSAEEVVDLIMPIAGPEILRAAAGLIEVSRMMPRERRPDATELLETFAQTWGDKA